MVGHLPEPQHDAPRREPIFNLPPAILVLGVLMTLIHCARVFLLTNEQDVDVLLLFAFIPVRYAVDAAQYALPGGMAADIWTFVSYAFLHGDFVHLAVNLFWFAAFGSAVAWRFGTLRFLVFSAVAAIGGAIAHLISNPDTFIPVIGASGAISGQMAAAARFVFFHHPRGPFSISKEHWRYPAPPLTVALRDSRVFIFLAVWFGLNLFVGIGAPPIAGAEGEIAWQAHIGGFLVGLLTFSAFDPVKRDGRSARV